MSTEQEDTGRDLDDTQPGDERFPEEGLEGLLEFLRDRRGFDFTGYKRPSLTRRIRKRMAAIGMGSYDEYVALLESQPGEFSELFDAILINVTGFLRDPEAWERISADVLPAIVDRADQRGSEVRIWSAGCASGQEAYTLAILMAEAVGEERFRNGVKIYATDADDSALRDARLARYPHSQLVDAFGPERAAQYFEDGDAGYTFRTDLRRSVIFGRHDLVQDPPISRIDLLVCRNTLMYFNADIQARILANFNFALVDGGFLFLGKAEAFATRVNLFSTLDLKRHIFVKRPRAQTTRPPLPAASKPPFAPPEAALALVSAAYESGPTAQLAIDREGLLVAANRMARSLFGLGTNQVGHPLRDLEVSYKPAELRSLIDQVLTSRRPVTLPEVVFRPPHGTTDTFDVVVQPVEDAGAVVGVTVTYVDVSRYKVLQDELEQSHRELEVAHEELQSAVEELETTNEELQSTNEELETLNTEMRRRTEETREANVFLQAILSGLNAGVAVLAPDLTVRAWNDQSEELWGLRSDEVDGQHFLNLDIGLPVEQLRRPIRTVLSVDGAPERVLLEAVNRRGRRIKVTVSITPLGGEADSAGVILLMEEVDHGGPTDS